MQTSPYSIAKQYLGAQEVPGINDNPLILRWLRLLDTSIRSEETAWCSAFASFCAREAGFERSNSLAARSWLQVGERIQLGDAKTGDVVILWRGSRSGWQGHVAFLDHHNPKRKLLYLLGGNQSDAVNIQTFSVDRLLGIRRLRPLANLEGKASRI